ncbi:alginate lyase family protein [Hymenobacter psychrophilus]|uniref:Alginate lyase n=1 Tax=Hymenobacter psychrophilus TaxID=651662 RepID=A0A1H3CIQ3_9BACT|nr:alginate lyase family protein [Hymenobacter psychrophilus]SDX54122.1 Alginate lyase [Hymenobacter psychrophilus]
MLKTLTLFCCLLNGVFATGCASKIPISANQSESLKQLATRTLRAKVLAEAAQALLEQPRTVTDSVATRSAGGPHDFFSEGDYWWPDPANPGGPYVQRDGQTNPANFVAHRRAMIRFSRIVGALASAYQLTHDERYARHALRHLRAWFLDPATLMNPSLLYSQAISGRFTGRGIGVIDTIQLLEVAQGVRMFEASSPAFRSGPELAGIKEWFSSYLTWLTTHPYGLAEMNEANNHGTCWTVQVAAFARLTGNAELLDFCRTRYKTVLLPTQMSLDGSFPLETRRTKPYGYSLFNLDAIATICAVLSTPTDDLWTYQTPDGRGIRRGIEFLYPYIENKAAWPFAHDVMYWNDWPVAHPSLVLVAVRFDNRQWLTTWQRLDHDPQVPEVLRNLPVRHPLIWL